VLVIRIVTLRVDRRWGILDEIQKRRLNSCGSCETELIGTGEYLKHITWARNFMLAQGYNMKSTILYQDNELTIKLINNGRRSSSTTGIFMSMIKFRRERLLLVTYELKKCGQIDCPNPFKATRFSYFDITTSI